MGLIKAAAGAAGGVLADQWKNIFTVTLCRETFLLPGLRKKLPGVRPTGAGQIM